MRSILTNRRSVPANPSAAVGLAAVNGSAATFLRSDAAPALSQAIAPTWTGAHTFTAGLSSTAPGTGTLNEAYGFLALESNTTGSSNLAVGYATLLLNTTGSANVAIGVQAMELTTTGFSNTAVGYLTLTNCQGSANVAIGFQALESVVAGASNIQIGQSTTGGTLTSGSFNTLIGADTDVAAAAQNYGTALGYAAVCAANELALSPHTNFVTNYGISSTTTTRPRFDLTAEVVDNTDATRKYGVLFRAWDTAAREFLCGEANGSAPEIGFLGATAVARQSIGAAATDAATTQTLANNIRTALINLGLCTT